MSEAPPPSNHNPSTSDQQPAKVFQIRERRLRISQGNEAEELARRERIRQKLESMGRQPDVANSTLLALHQRSARPASITVPPPVFPPSPVDSATPPAAPTPEFLRVQQKLEMLISKANPQPPPVAPRSYQAVIQATPPQVAPDWSTSTANSANSLSGTVRGYRRLNADERALREANCEIAKLKKELNEYKKIVAPAQKCIEDPERMRSLVQAVVGSLIETLEKSGCPPKYGEGQEERGGGEGGREGS